MKYIKVCASNGFCGCDEEFLLEVPKDWNDNAIFEEILNNYTYESGAAGIDPDDEEFEFVSYEECIANSTSWEEITKEAFIKLRDKEDWEVR